MQNNEPCNIEGDVLLIDKPMDWTSFDVVCKIRNTLSKYAQVKRIKVGHSGTLDPLATGLLIVCIGKKTKTIDTLQGLDKCYEGSMILGATTPSFDKETEINATFSLEDINKTKIIHTIKQFSGKIIQKPPIFSAVKIDGEAAYKKARKGEEVKVREREVEIYDFQITKIDLPEVYFKVHCSKGTYIRSLVDDFGKALNNGAHLSSLRRLSIGDFSLKNALQLDEFLKQFQIEKESESI